MTKTLSPSKISEYLVPSRCARRVWLKENRPDLEDRELDVFQEFVQKQGIRHEERMLDELRGKYPDWTDVGGKSNPNAFTQTVDLIDEGKELIYQGLLVQQEAIVADQKVSVIGYPDFMIKVGDGYEIADAKLARTIYETDRSGAKKLKSKRLYIELQLQLYGWLFHRLFPNLEFSLSVLNGKGDREAVAFDGGSQALTYLATILEFQALANEPWEPVGRSKCLACSFKDHCWERAKEAKETGLVPDISQALCRKLKGNEDIETYPELMGTLGAQELAALKNESAGSDDPDNLAGAERILENVKALIDGTPVLRNAASGTLDSHRDLLSDPSYVMFDLEGVPPDIDQEWDKVYLWGMQVFGESPGGFQYALAGFDEPGDKAGWDEFLVKARALLDQHPDIRFVHWASYENTKITQYIERYPNSDVQTAMEVREQLLDLLKVTKRLVALPLYSYSLKEIEKMKALTEATGFSRSAKAVASGDASIAAYMEALETRDERRQAELMQQVIDYNEEDLMATWAVMRWLSSLVVKA